MIRRPTRFAAALLCLAWLIPAPALAQLSNANVVAVCGAPNVTYGANTTKAITQDTGGKLCGAGGTAPPPLVVAATDVGGTVTAGGTAQNAAAINLLRKGWCIQNDPAATEKLEVRTDAAATATSGTVLQPGQQVCNPVGIVTTGAISVLAATTGHRWFGQEFQ